jgi:6-phosphogluconolactonase
MSNNTAHGKIVVLAAVGAAITWYDMDVEACTLVPRQVSQAPQNVQYIWPGPAGRNLFYIASTNQGPRKEAPGGAHWLSAYRADVKTATLVPHGEPVPLPHRPVHLTIDATGRFALVAYPRPALASVHRINADGTMGAEVKQSPTLEVGIFPHQVRMLPSNRGAVLVTRGNDATRSTPEDPGALKVLDMNDGALSNRQSATPGGGYGFGPRHIDIDAAGRWVYASLERQNQLAVFSLRDDTLSADPVYVRTTLKNPAAILPASTHQLTSTVHVHPSKSVVYVANRASGMAQPGGGRAVFEGGDNSIAVFAINPQTGEPTLVQNEDTRGIHPRTFAIDPTGRMMVVAHIQAITVREGDATREQPASLTTFHVGSDGQLQFVNKYDVKTDDQSQFWMGMVALN